MPEKRISSALHFERRFLRSVQLERDYKDPSSLAGYVVTDQIRSCVHRLVLGLNPNSGQRAWRITGDYGSGKSAFALLLAHLFGHVPLGTARRSLRAIDVDSFEVGKPRLVPVLVTGSRESLSVALLRSLVRDANQVLRTDRRLLRKAQGLLEREAVEVRDEEVVEVLQRAVRAARVSRKAAGILLLVDELGKFLEFGVLHPDRQDIYLLQRIAEAASHSGEEPLFVVGLLHQGFSAYAENLSPTAQREWEKVAGRFEEMVFAQPLSDVASLVCDALNVKAGLLSRAVNSIAKVGMDKTVGMGWYGAGVSRQKLAQVATRLYPLHPTVLPVLVQLFRRFGQNERSLFGFMLSTEPFGLMEFASTRDIGPGSFYQIHNLYDYARASFGNRLSAQSFRSHWNHIESLIESFHTNDEAELRILKTVGLLNVRLTPAISWQPKRLFAQGSRRGGGGGEKICKFGCAPAWPQRCFVQSRRCWGILPLAAHKREFGDSVRRSQPRDGAETAIRHRGSSATFNKPPACGKATLYRDRKSTAFLS